MKGVSSISYLDVLPCLEELMLSKSYIVWFDEFNLPAFKPFLSLKIHDLTFHDLSPDVSCFVLRYSRYFKLTSQLPHFDQSLPRDWNLCKATIIQISNCPPIQNTFFLSSLLHVKESKLSYDYNSFQLLTLTPWWKFNGYITRKCLNLGSTFPLKRIMLVTKI